jgi:hypothetical protein
LNTALVGIDFMDFAVNAEPVSRLAELEDPLPNRLRWVETARALFTITGLQDSLHTLAARSDQYAATLQGDGFNPMRDYERVAQRSGYRAMFKQRFDETNRRLHTSRLGILPPEADDSAELAALRELIHTAQRRGVRLVLFSYPYHSDYLSLIEQVDAWHDFEEWKRRVSLIVADANQAEPKAHPVRFVDFATWSDYSTLPVPSRGDGGAAQWYWEGGHFKQQLGDLMLGGIANPASMTGKHPLGRSISDDNLGPWLETQRALSELHSVRVRQQPDAFLCCHNPGN